jgi:uncharacterized membrane protein
VELRRKVEEAGASVSFAEAPGDRGRELAVEWVDAPPADDLGRLAAKLTGRDLATQLAHDLRRFKQVWRQDRSRAPMRRPTATCSLVT